MSRAYNIDGIEWPSVTTILGVLGKGDALIQWAANCAVNYLEQNPGEYDAARKNWREAAAKAMDIGSEIHQLIEKYIKEGKDAVGELRDEVSNGFLAFLEWEKENGIEWLESEQNVINKLLGYAGTLDAVAKFSKGPLADKIFVIDFKSSKAIYPEYSTQISAYYSAYTLYKPASGMAILRLDKLTGQPEFKDVTKGHERRMEAFKYLVQYYYVEKKRRLKNNPFVMEVNNGKFRLNR